MRPALVIGVGMTYPGDRFEVVYFFQQDDAATPGRNGYFYDVIACADEGEAICVASRIVACARRELHVDDRVALESCLIRAKGYFTDAKAWRIGNGARTELPLPVLAPEDET